MKSHFVSWKLLTVCLWAFLTLTARADYQPTYSTAGFYERPNTGRTVYRHESRMALSQRSSRRS